MNHCRYDYTATAIRALCKYLDSSADLVNTMALLEVAERALGDLKQMEKQIPRGPVKRVPLPKMQISSALADLRQRLEPLEDKAEAISDFLTGNKAAIAKIKDMAVGIKRMEEALGLLNRINKSVNQIVSAADKEFI